MVGAEAMVSRNWFSSLGDRGAVMNWSRIIRVTSGDVWTEGLPMSIRLRYAVRLVAPEGTLIAPYAHQRRPRVRRA